MTYLDKENANKIITNSEYKILYVVNEKNKMKVTTSLQKNQKDIFKIPNIIPEQLGSEEFKKDYNVKFALCSGAMANKIASTAMVISMGKSGFLGSFGAGGCSIKTVEEAIDEIEKELPKRNYMINILANRDVQKEMNMVEMLVAKNVPAVEVSAYVKISEALIYYRASGLRRESNGDIFIPHKIMAKISREELIKQFVSPPDMKILEKLLKLGKISKEEALLARKIPMADDITVEADSGGHTDGRPLVSILPAMISMCNNLQKEYDYKKKVRIGAAGGIGTGLSALGAFSMGAAYIVTGSVNQTTVEAGTSEYVKEILKDVSMADVVMAPSADRFEFGGMVQVIKKGTMYAQNARKLYEYYKKYDSLEEIPKEEYNRIENKIIKNKLETIWNSTKEYFAKVDPSKINDAERNPKKKMALIFRWYLGKSSKWAVNGDLDRKMDMQIWCGQSLGAFNKWVKGTYLEELSNRKIVDISYTILKCAAYLYIVKLLTLCNVDDIDYNDFKIERNDNNVGK